MRARQLQLVLEALERIGILVNRQREHLQRDHFVDRFVDGGADVAHRAGAEESLDAVAAREDVARREHRFDGAACRARVVLRHRLDQRGLALRLGGDERRIRFLALVGVAADERRRRQLGIVDSCSARIGGIAPSALAAEAVDRAHARAAAEAGQVVARLAKSDVSHRSPPTRRRSERAWPASESMSAAR